MTAGGVPLDEIDTATMESRRQPGLYLVGEILDVDGRLGGFNFQWAWSSGWVAGQALARALTAGLTRSRRRPAGVPAAWLVTIARCCRRRGDALDVACGRGRNAMWLARAGFHDDGRGPRRGRRWRR